MPTKKKSFQKTIPRLAREEITKAKKMMRKIAPKKDSLVREKKRAELITEHLSHSGLDEFVQYLHSPWRIMWSNLLAGIFRGLGFILGATVVLATITYILIQILGSLPFIGDWFVLIGEFFSDLQKATENLQSIGG